MWATLLRNEDFIPVSTENSVKEVGIPDGYECTGNLFAMSGEKLEPLYLPASAALRLGVIKLYYVVIGHRCLFQRMCFPILACSPSQQAPGTSAAMGINLGGRLWRVGDSVLQFLTRCVGEVCQNLNLIEPTTELNQAKL